MKTCAWLALLACLPLGAAWAANPVRTPLRLALDRPVVHAPFALGNGVALPGADDTDTSPFAFRDTRYRDPPPPRANDRDAVLGLVRAWVGGKPPVECARTPMDMACH